MKTIYVSIISFITNFLPVSEKEARLMPPLPSEILASDAPPFRNFQHPSVEGVWIFSGTTQCTYKVYLW